MVKSPSKRGQKKKAEKKGENPAQKWVGEGSIRWKRNPYRAAGGGQWGGKGIGAGGKTGRKSSDLRVGNGLWRVR